MRYSILQRFSAGLLLLLLFAGGRAAAQQTVPFLYDGNEGSVRVQFLLFAESNNVSRPNLEAVPLAEHPALALSDYHNAYIVVRLSDFAMERRRDYDRYYLEVPELLINYGRGLKRRPIPGGRVLLIAGESTLETGQARADIRFDVDLSIKSKIQHELNFGFNVKRVSDGGVVTHITAVKQPYELLPGSGQAPASGNEQPDRSEADRQEAQREYETIAALPAGEERTRQAEAFIDRWEPREARSARIRELIEQARRLSAPPPSSALTRKGPEAAVDAPLREAPLAPLAGTAVRPLADSSRPELTAPQQTTLKPEASNTDEETKARQADENAWREARLQNTREAYEEYFQVYGEKALYADAALEKLAPFEAVIQVREKKADDLLHFQLSIAGSEGKTPRVRITEGQAYLKPDQIRLDGQQLSATLPMRSKVTLELNVDGSPWKNTTLTLDASPTPLAGSFGPAAEGLILVSGLRGGSPPYYLEVLDLERQRHIVNIVELGEEEQYEVRLSKLFRHSGQYKLRITDQSRTAMASLESPPIDFQKPPLVPARWLYGTAALLLLGALSYFGLREYRKKKEMAKTRAYMRRLKSEVYKKQQAT